MSELSYKGGTPRGYPRDSLRLTFRFTRESIELVSQEYLEMITPPSVGRPPVAGENSGSWLELRDPKHERVIAQVLHDPFRTGIDHHSPDGRIEHYQRELTEGEFDALVPAVRGATSVSLVTSDFPSTRAGRGAVEVARFDLERRER